MSLARLKSGLSVAVTDQESSALLVWREFVVLGKGAALVSEQAVHEAP